MLKYHRIYSINFYITFQHTCTLYTFHNRWRTKLLFLVLALALACLVHTFLTLPNRQCQWKISKTSCFLFLDFLPFSRDDGFAIDGKSSWTKKNGRRRASSRLLFHSFIHQTFVLLCVFGYRFHSHLKKSFLVNVDEFYVSCTCTLPGIRTTFSVMQFENEWIRNFSF